MSSEKKITSMAKSSLTVQSSLALAVLIVLEALLPLYTGLEVPEEVFVTLCSLLGASVTYGMRRALLPILILAAPLSFYQCTSFTCDKARITISEHPEGLPAPAGLVKITCNGEEKIEIVAKSVPKVGCESAAVCCEGQE